MSKDKDCSMCPWAQQHGSGCWTSGPCRVWCWSADWSRVFGLRARQSTGRMGRQTHRGDIPSGASTDWHWPQGLSNVLFTGETVNKVREARPHSCRSPGLSGTSVETQTQQRPQSLSCRNLHTALHRSIRLVLHSKVSKELQKIPFPPLWTPLMQCQRVEK